MRMIHVFIGLGWLPFTVGMVALGVYIKRRIGRKNQLNGLHKGK